MKFNPDRVGMGRHESFPLRYAWLSRGFKEFKANPHIFEEEDAITTLGVGKNMVRSIRFWLIATRMIQACSRYHYEESELGAAIFGDNGWDPYLEDDTTIWLLHWLLSTNPEQTTVNYWFFNQFHKATFNSGEVQTAFRDFCKENVAARFAVTTANRDASVLLRMYSRSKTVGKGPQEESLDSPLSALNLLSYTSNGRAYSSVPDKRAEISTAIMGFAVSSLFNAACVTELPTESLMYSDGYMPAIGSVFRLSENGLIAHLERLVAKYRDIWDLRETAGIHQLYRLTDCDPMDYLRDHFLATNGMQGIAA